MISCRNTFYQYLFDFVTPLLNIILVSLSVSIIEDIGNIMYFVNHTKIYEDKALLKSSRVGASDVIPC